jgi:hypothetical protein
MNVAVTNDVLHELLLATEGGDRQVAPVLLAIGHRAAASPEFPLFSFKANRRGAPGRFPDGH